jgi:hypothetical protein
VAKHSYVKGKRGQARICAHVDYLQNRPGHDREDGPRKFFNSDRDGIEGGDVKRELKEQGYAKVVAHKLILSPGVDGVDVDAYTRKVMQDFQNEKGQDCKWWSVRHENTDHDHAHVLIAGLDVLGHDVSFKKDDYAKIRELGDLYLERHHELERYLDKDIERLLNDRSKDVSLDRFLSGIKYEQTGDRQFKELLRDVEVREKKEKDKRETGEDERVFKKFESDLKKSFEEGLRPGADFGKGHEQRLRESQGRLSESHSTYTTSVEINRLQQELERHPERSEELQAHIADLRRLGQEEQRYGRKFDALDDLLGTKPKDLDRQKGKDIDRAQGQQQQVNETSRQIVTGELQKQLQPEHERDRDEDEDMFSRGER